MSQRVLSIPAVSLQRGSLKDGATEYVADLFEKGYTAREVRAITGLWDRSSQIVETRSKLNPLNQYRIFTHSKPVPNVYYRYRMTFSLGLVELLRTEEARVFEIDIDTSDNLVIKLPDMGSINYSNAVFITGDYNNLRRNAIRFYRAESPLVVDFLLAYPGGEFICEDFRPEEKLFQPLPEAMLMKRQGWHSFATITETTWIEGSDV